MKGTTILFIQGGGEGAYEKFPGANFRTVTGCDHQLNNDLSEVATDINGLI